MGEYRGEAAAPRQEHFPHRASPSASAPFPQSSWGKGYAGIASANIGLERKMSISSCVMSGLTSAKSGVER